ncbi:cellulose biosynthesis cyclic di-GMP-binding regulatory protein BcsB [Nocardia spumae]|uniref:cellulose biosynthesis cyclic di-GMP-binding regulatory protein BcsB n=1 Tax=Nocardia spumae TaxID=2887190 RepID=UPI001D136B71|nr:cellulose biosynthesis cyclic di-GMP-binding regulatory protein BcsB [Nocardia spumae]
MPIAKRLLNLVAAGAALLTFIPISAVAQPPAATSNDTPLVVDSRALGLGDTVALRGTQDQRSLTIPVPPGLTPSTLSLQVDMPANVARGWIEARSGDLTSARAELPAGPATSVPLTLPLTGIPVDRQAASITLDVSLLPRDGLCPDVWYDHSVVLRNLRFGFSGAPELPTVIADFLPPLLQRLRIAIPAQPDAQEIDAALQLDAAVVAHYGTQPVRVVTEALAGNSNTPAEPDGPFDRTVVIRRGPSAGTNLTPMPSGPPALLVTGEGEALIDQARLITSDVSAVAVDTGAVAGSIDQPPVLAPASTTLGQLGAGTLSATSHGQVSVEFGVDQTHLGRNAHNIRVLLSGTYTPPPPTQSGLLTVMVGDRVVTSWAAESSGRIQRWIDIPDDVLARTTTVAVTLQTTGGTAGCGLDLPLTLTIFPESQVTSEASPSGPPFGFQALPQALLPSVNVAADGHGYDDAARAITLIAAQQRLTSTRLDPRWVTMSEATDSSHPAILIAGQGRVPDGITLPLSVSTNNTVRLTHPDGGTTEIKVDAFEKYASIQTLHQNERELLVATSDSGPAELDRTLAWLDAQSSGWANLSGDLIFTVPGRDPVELSLPHSTSKTSTSSGLSSTAVTVLVIAAALLALGVLIAVIVAWRRSTR